MKVYHTYFGILTFWCCALFGGETTPNEPPHSVVVQLKWSHQFQFAGFYAAKELGYYRDAGLNVDIKERDFETIVLDEVLSGRAHFGVSDATLIMNRLKGVPVVALLASYQYSPLVIITREEDNIINPIQLKNKRVMFQKHTDDSTILALFKQYNLTSSDLEHVKFLEPEKALTNHEIDAYSGYITNQPYLHKKNGLAINIINPANYGLDFIGEFIFTSEQYLKSNKQQVEDFRAATIKGWQYALNNPEQVVDWIIHIYHAKKSKAALMHEAEITKTLFDVDLSRVGEIEPQRLQRVEKLYKNINVAPSQANLNGFVIADYDDNAFKYWRALAIIALSFILACGVLFRKYHQIGVALTRISAFFSKTALIEATHQQMIEQNILTYRTDKEDCFVFVSPAFCLKLGYSENELIGCARAALYHPKFSSSLVAKITKSVTSRLMWSGEIMYRDKQGEAVWHRSQLDPIIKNDYLLGFSSIEYDISDKKRLEQSAVTDDATGLFNRFKIEQLIHYERNRSVRTSLPFSILFVEFDVLAIVQEKEGDLAVNNMLLGLASIVNHEIRISDTAGRWGTEQLLVICPETSEKGAYYLGTKITNSVEKFNFSTAIALKINIAAGQLDNNEDVTQLLQRTEKKLG